MRVAKVHKHHVINSSIAAVIATIVSLSAWFVIETASPSSGQVANGTTLCFKNGTGQVYLREKCKSGEKRVVLNATGAQGARGFSNYELALQAGFIGSLEDWLKSLIGPPGASASGGQGPTGPAGPQGAPGRDGIDGFTPAVGYFIDVTSQSLTGPNTPTPMRFGTDVIANHGVTIGGAHRTQITFSSPGIYNIQFSAQVFKASSNSVEDIDIWLSQNGQIVSNSNTQQTVTNEVGKTGKEVASWNFVVSTTATNEYCEIYWTAASTIVTIPYIAPQTNPNRPGIPSLILTVIQVG